MKRISLLILPILLCIILIACDTTGETTSTSSTNSKLESETNESSATSSNESSKDNSVSNTSSEASEYSKEEVSGEQGNQNLQKEFEVSVTINGTTALGNAGFSIKSGYNKTHKIVLSGTADAINAIDSSKIKADIDVSSTSSIGTFEYLIIYTVPNNVNIVSTSA